MITCGANSTDIQNLQLTMTKPYLVLTWMAIFVLSAILAALAAHDPIIFAFKANPWFNSLIVLVLAAGLAYNFLQVVNLAREIEWIEHFRSPKKSGSPRKTTPLLAPMERMLAQKTGNHFTLSTLSMRSLLDSITNRMEESRDISRYLIGLLIFLGLLGTFWGLLITISSASDVIKNMSADGDNSLLLFENLKQGLQQPLAGMGVAFSSSFFGLAGSLVLGFTDLQTSHAQRRFFNELEEWLSGITRLSSGALTDIEDVSVPEYVQALLEKTADGIETLERTLGDQVSERSRLDSNLFELTRQLAELSEYLKRDQQPMSEELRKEFRILARTIGASLAHRKPPE